ncbi:MAG: amidase [Janthinobacterium lividum]
MKDIFLSQTLDTIAQSIKLKKFSSYELVSYYCNTIKEVNPLINAVIRFDEDKALAKASAADKLLAEGHILGPLHGIPFTAKDWLETKEFISTAGMEERRNYLPKEDATVITRLQNAGAILLGKTNVPYNGTSATENPIFGTTNNPYNLKYSPGWSSGGEAAIISAGGTAFGVGSDSGGSIRTPCHFCGIAGLKASTGRIPATGHFPEIGGFMDPRSQIGPLARYVKDLAYLFPIIAGGNGKDPYVVETPYFLTPSLSSLNLAYYVNHHNITPIQDIAKITQECAEFVKKDVKTISLNEPKALSSVMDLTNTYWNIYKGSVGTKEYLELTKKWDQFRKEMWIYMQPYDAIITPVATSTAHPHKDTPAENIVYTLTYSLLGWPCVVVRVGTSEQGLPINIQVVAKPFHEEICLLIASRLEKMCGWQEPKIK